MLRLAALVFFGWVSSVSFADGPFSQAGAVGAIRWQLKQVSNQLTKLESGQPAGGELLEPPTDTGEKSPFFQRLEAYDNWKASRLRLDTIERELQKLEDDVASERAGGRDDEDFRRLETLARTQRLVVQELKYNLDQIYRHFQELDRQIASHQQSIDAVEGGLAKVSPDFRQTASGLKSHIVAKSSASYESVLDAQKLFTRDIELSDVWVFPRTELSWDDTTNLTSQITVGVEGSLFGLVKGDAKGGFVFDTRYSTSASVLSPGTEAVLTTRGAATRDSAVFCGVSKTISYRGFGSVGAGGGLDLKVVKFNGGVSLEVGDTIAIGARRYSPILQFRQGETFASKIEECRKYAKQIRDNDALEQEVRGMMTLMPLPESPCYRDYDCRNTVQSGLLRESAVAACVPTPGRERAVCATRYADTPSSSCLLPGERAWFFKRYECAPGLVCDTKSRNCRTEKTPAEWLKSVGIQEAKAVSFSVPYGELFDDQGKTKGAAYCESQGLKGWVLPNGDQLRATAAWFRGWARKDLRAKSPNSPAQRWWYAPQLFTQMIWSEGTSVYLLSNDSASRYNPADPQNAVLFRDPDTGKTVQTGIAVCVKPAP